MGDIDNTPTLDNEVQETTPAEGEVAPTGEEGVKGEVVEDESAFSPFEEVEEKKEETPSTKTDIDDDDRDVMKAVFQDENKSTVEEVQGLKTDIKVNTFLSDEQNQVYKPYEKEIRKFAKSPVAKGLKPEAIARMAVDPREMMNRGAEAERKASKETRDTATPGSVVRKPEGSNKIANAWNLAPDKFKETIEKAKRNRQ